MNKKLLNIKFISLFCIFIIFDIKNMESSNLYLKINKIDQYVKNGTEPLITIENKKINNNIEIIKNPNYSLISARNFFFLDEGFDTYLTLYLTLKHLKEQYNLDNGNIQQILYYIKLPIFCSPLEKSMINITNTITPQPLKVDSSSYYCSLINIPNHEKAFFTFFRTKKAFFTYEYIVTDCRHQLINGDMKKEEAINTFHDITVYKINDFLNHSDNKIELHPHNTPEPIQPFLKIKLPTHLQKYHKLSMKLIAFQDKTIIIQQKSPSEKNYLCISLNPNLSIIDSIVPKKSIPIETEPEIVEKTIVSPLTTPNSKTPHINKPKYRITKFNLTIFIFTTLLFLYHYKFSVINFLI